ncbi:hypothetical protein SAMN05428989_1121 [Pseudoxanthomonas sp. GM95]|uniref:hypothetical protein n=1 Tax=Pseudoxanthomonas sp. GM95 TaxID=1881043 RepID=UPI0008D62289|nr:hypothetical protein [Pseudoxanthomonas sp. GM95]SEK94544.1 hypothetical protein SAMN05428989_1121 [Pseudoxanthomonas sp. GM95]
MGPVRYRFASEADYRFSYARYCLQWWVGFMVAAIVLLPVGLLASPPASLVIPLVLVLVFGIGVSGLGALSHALAGWQAQRTPGKREQKIVTVLGALLGVVFFGVLEAFLGVQIWLALATGELEWHSRSHPTQRYTWSESPVEFALHLGILAVIAMVFPGCLVWLLRERRRLRGGLRNRMRPFAD